MRCVIAGCVGWRSRGFEHLDFLPELIHAISACIFPTVTLVGVKGTKFVQGEERAPSDRRHDDGGHATNGHTCCRVRRDTARVDDGAGGGNGEKGGGGEGRRLSVGGGARGRHFTGNRRVDSSRLRLKEILGPDDEATGASD